MTGSQCVAPGVSSSGARSIPTYLNLPVSGMVLLPSGGDRSDWMVVVEGGE